MHSLLRFSIQFLNSDVVECECALEVARDMNHFPKYSTLLPNTVLTLENLFLQKKAFPNKSIFLSDCLLFNPVFCFSVVLHKFFFSLL